MLSVGPNQRLSPFELSLVYQPSPSPPALDKIATTESFMFIGNHDSLPPQLLVFSRPPLPPPARDKIVTIGVFMFVGNRD